MSSKSENLGQRNNMENYLARRLQEHNLEYDSDLVALAAPRMFDLLKKYSKGKMTKPMVKTVHNDRYDKCKKLNRNVKSKLFKKYIFYILQHQEWILNC